MLFNKNMFFMFFGVALITAISTESFAQRAAVARPEVRKEIQRDAKKVEAANDSSSAAVSAEVKNILKDNISPAARELSLNLDIAAKLSASQIKAIVSDSARSQAAADLIKSKTLNKADKLELGALTGALKVIAFTADKIDVDTIKSQVATYKGTESFKIYVNFINTKGSVMKDAVDHGSKLTDREAEIATVVTLRNVAKTGSNKLVRLADVSAKDREEAGKVVDELKDGRCTI